MKHISALAYLFVLVGPALGAGEEARLVLDERAYFRTYIEFGLDRMDPDLLKRDAEKVLGADGMKRLESTLKRCQALAGKPEGNWQADPLYYVSQETNVGADDREAWAHIATPPPPDGWTAGDFDDADWFRQRLPNLVGNLYWRGRMHGDSAMRQSAVRRACLRTSFEVGDPAKDGPYVLRLAFRGGARVLVNGVEIGRAFLPPGELDGEARAEPYSLEAYLCMDDERSEASLKKIMARMGGNFCQELAGRFEDPSLDPQKESSRKEPLNEDFYPESLWGVGDIGVHRKAWERITRLRNREMGPLEIPASALKPGRNVLAIEIRRSDLHPVVEKNRMFRQTYWSHARLLDVSLHAHRPPASALDRPKGLQVWVEDIHRRCYSPDFASDDRAGQLFFVGGPNGEYGAQLVVAASHAIGSLSLAPSALKSEGGAEIPAAALSIAHLQGHPVSEMIQLGQGRNFPGHRKDPLCPPAEMAILRFAGHDKGAQRLPREAQLKEIQQMQFFDHLVPGLPAGVPAGQCQPLWLSLKIPADAKPSVYVGSLELTADGRVVKVPVRAEVHGWRVPEPRDFQSVMALEQSPYGVAKHYGVKLWSEEHFALLEASFKELARVGNDWLFIPIAENTEFGNRADSMIRWVRKADGSWDFDFATLDRYVDLATKAIGRPKVICFVVMHGGDSYGGKAVTRVSYHDKKTGEDAMVSLDSQNDDPAPWQAFSQALYKHMRARELEKSMYWGFGWDANGDPGLIPLLAQFVPKVKWSRGAHGLGGAGKADDCFSATSQIYNIQLPATSKLGWKNPYIHLLLPRSGSSVMSSNGHAPPFAFRLMVDRALVAGMRGIARLGADYWAESYFEGAKSPTYAVGMPCSQMLWPGPKGAQSGVRFEILREGIQETEARIFIEQALDGGLLSGELATRAQEVLNRHNRETLYLSVGTVGIAAQEYCSGWRERSRRLYAMAAEAAAAVGFDVYPTALQLELAARDRDYVEIRVRHGSGGKMAWTASADQPWIEPQPAQGDAAGQTLVRLWVNGAKLKPGETAKGSVNIVSGGKTVPVELTVRAGKVFEVLVGDCYDFLKRPGHAAAFGPEQIESHLVFNVDAGGRETKEWAFLNHTSSTLNWKATASNAWLAAEPSSGTLAAGEVGTLRLVAQPPGAEAASMEAVVTVSEQDGEALQTLKAIVHLIPPYKEPPRPNGTAAPLSTLGRDRVTEHRTRFYSVGTSDKRREDYGPKFEAEGKYAAKVPQLTVYDLKDAGIKGFSAKVQVDPHYAGEKSKQGKEGLHTRLVNFEVWVDGTLRAQSGLLRSGDAPRLLAVEGLESAKELRMVTRFDTPESKNLIGVPDAQWLEPTIYK